mmetsp:Transcript_12242/g.34643  ORF Transcript_12242/g.34643 Transcript_12242/m.34643 type:complete len:206 (-) Transcript_12242:36-653(-)
MVQVGGRARAADGTDEIGPPVRPRRGGPGAGPREGGRVVEALRRARAPVLAAPPRSCAVGRLRRWQGPRRGHRVARGRGAPGGPGGDAPAQCPLRPRGRRRRAGGLGAVVALAAARRGPGPRRRAVRARPRALPRGGRVPRPGGGAAVGPAGRKQRPPGGAAPPRVHAPLQRRRREGAGGGPAVVLHGRPCRRRGGGPLEPVGVR